MKVIRNNKIISVIRKNGYWVVENELHKPQPSNTNTCNLKHTSHCNTGMNTATYMAMFVIKVILIGVLLFYLI